MSWETIKLGDLCTIEKGTTGIQKAVPGKYPMVVTSEERKSHNEFQFDDEAVVIPLVSSTGHGHKSLKRIHYQTGKFALGSILCAVIPKNKKQLNAEYLFRYLDLNKENELVSRMKGMANVTLPIKEIADIDIPVPPLSEQLHFIEKYELTETHSEGLQNELLNQIHLLSRLRQSFLREAMQGKLVKQDSKDGHGKDLLEKIKAEKAKSGRKEKELPAIKPEEIPFEIPENWVWCRLGEICENSFYGPRFGKSEYVENGIPTIRTTDMTDNGEIMLRSTPCVFVNDRKKIELYKVNDGDLLVTRSGSIGIMAVFRGDYLAFPSAYLIRFRFMKKIVPEFVYLLLKSPFWQTLLGLNSRATAQVNINAVNILKLPIPLPPYAEQNRIVARLDELFKLCDGLQESIQSSCEQNEMLLQQVLKEALQTTI